MSWGQILLISAGGLLALGGLVWLALLVIAFVLLNLWGSNK